jgi:uncharacterized protein (DUF1697 family)
VDRWFAFLRAINTGNRRLTNEQLLAPFRALGFDGVAAYQAAGNVTFRSSGPVDEAAIGQALTEAYGFDTPAFVRSAEEIAFVVAAEPFTADELAVTAGKVQVAFLRSAPTADQLAALADLTPEEDRATVFGREWYWLPVDGVSGSQLPVGRIEGVLGEMTMRTLGTVQRMAVRFP